MELLRPLDRGRVLRWCRRQLCDYSAAAALVACLEACQEVHHLITIFMISFCWDRDCVSYRHRNSSSESSNVVAAAVAMPLLLVGYRSWP